MYVYHAFLYISLTSLHDHNVKFPNFTFAEDGNKRQQLSFSFPELCCSPLEFNSKKNLPTFDELKLDGISEIKFGPAQIHFLSDVFVALAVVIA